MNQEYKKGTLLAAVAGIITLGVGIYFLTKNFKDSEGFYKFTTISTLVSILLLVIFAFVKLNKIAVGCLMAAFMFGAINYIKYMEYYSNAMEYLFKSKGLRFDAILYLTNLAFSPYFSFVLTVLALILFILCFTTPNRKGIAVAVIVFEVIHSVVEIAGIVGYISGNSEYAKYIKDFWADNILNIVDSLASLLLVIGICTSVMEDDPLSARAGRAMPQGGMYGIPYAERPRQNSQFGFGSGMNVYNTPQNPNYDQQGMFNQRNMFGQPQMGGFGQQGMNYNQPQNMGGFGQPQMGGYGQQGMNYNQPQNMGGFGQPQMGSFGQPQNMSGYGQPQNMGGFGQPQMGNFGQPAGSYNQQAMGGNNQKNNGSQDFNKQETPQLSENPAGNLPTESLDNSIFDKPDNGVSFEQPQSFTSTDI